MGMTPGVAAVRRLKRPYTRKSTNNAPGIRPPTSPPQIPDLAFNIHGWGLQDGMTWRRTFEVINAYKATMVKGGFEAKIHELHEENQGMVYREDLRYTPRELDPNLASTDPSVAQYLVVGYTLQEEDPVFLSNKTFARYSENELVGETRPQPQNMIMWNHVRTPILVVTPIKENTGTSVRLFGLIMPRSGLCQPVLLTHERIFYRWEFRASAGARAAQRNKNWNQVVIDKARELTPPEALVPQTDGAFERPIKRRRSSTSVALVKQEEEDFLWPEITENDLEQSEVFELVLALEDMFEALADRYNTMTIPPQAPNVMTRLKILLTPESRGIINAIRTSRSSRINQEIQANLSRVSRGHKIPSAESAQGLMHFAYPGTTFGKSEADMVVNEIKELWPKMAHLPDNNSVLRIKEVMNEAGLAISLEAMKDFFATALPMVRLNPNMADDELQKRLHEVIQSAVYLNQPASLEGQVDTNIGIDAIFLVTLLKEILVIQDWQSNGTKTMYMLGPAPPSFAGIEMEHYLDIRSVEAATEDLLTTIKYLIGSAKGKGCGVDDVLLWLERLRLRIRQV
ncbi:hypothetical protein OHC33_007188 [Knufia fluminis]|uniref:Uncharacterized protein n=1 Tax=Knufia fluminis TaxID=191047 RepID=A0AAN8EDW4_9EURO|nr:hypothetical protein OHC33_007188 [Knufia fluminis]